MTTASIFVQVSIAFSAFLHAAEVRMQQFLLAIAHRASPDVDQKLQDLLASDAQLALLSRLSTFDRDHHLRVWTTLRQAGESDRDLLNAALLHDVGKADDRGRVMLVHRVVRVLGRQFTPNLLVALTQPSSRCYVHGLYLAEHHARLGAKLARIAGASERSCYLIAKHEEEPVTNDAALQSLISADRKAHL